MLALSRVQVSQLSLIRQLINITGSAKILLENAGNLNDILPEATPQLKKMLSNPTLTENAEKELEFIEKNNIKPIYIGEKKYPYRLFECGAAAAAGDGDLPLALGHSHLLAAPGTIVIAVILIFQLLEEQQKFPVLFIALINISGKATEDRNKHKSIGDSGEAKLNQRTGNQRSQQRKNKTCAENCHIQLVGTVTAHHKIA